LRTDAAVCSGSEAAGQNKADPGPTALLPTKWRSPLASKAPAEAAEAPQGGFWHPQYFRAMLSNMPLCAAPERVATASGNTGRQHLGEISGKFLGDRG